MAERWFRFETPISDYHAGYQSSVDSTGSAKHTVNTMEIELTFEQRSRLELIAMHAGKPSGQMLVEAAEFLVNQDPAAFQPPPPQTQKFLPEAELEARFTRILRY